MRKYLFLISLAATSFLTASSQDLSTKGKEFWVGYGYHYIMTNGANAQDMVLYFATDQVTNVTVSIPGLGYSVTYSNIAANTVFQTPAIPKGSPDARLFTEGVSDKGIHIVSDKPIIAYAHIYNASVSGATILYPTNTLGKEYYSVNYTNNSNTTNSNCWFYVIAADPGTTTVEITPSANTIGGWVAGSTYTVNLTQGQIYNVMGTTSGNNGVDLTGSKIRSIASGTGGCKRIAVFSGSGRIAIACNGTAPSSDNYMVEALPKTAWGKKYLAVPSASYTSTNGTGLPLMQNSYRVCVTDPTTVVKINGSVTALPLQGNFYYEIPSTTTLQRIEADKPIMVAQYFPSQGTSGCGTVAGDGDPEVIYLSSVEQSINTVRWDACKNYSINSLKHYINIIIPNAGTAISSCTLDGVTIPASKFTVHPQDANYSYAVVNVSGSGTVSIPHTVQSDSGFNAIAYGYGAAESYGYNAGTYIKDLYTHPGTTSQYGITEGAVCTGSPFKFKISLPYQPDSIYWDLSGIVNTPQYGIEKLLPTLPATTLVPDSITTVNLKPVYWYALPNFYNFSNVGSYNIPITAFAANADGCGTQQDYDFPLNVSNPPVGSFTITPGGCYAEAYKFTETTSQTPVPTYRWYWDFGDGPANIISGTNPAYRNPTHTYAAPGTYTVRFCNITTSGCVSDTATQIITVPDLPTATISTTATAVCQGAASPVITFTGTQGTPGYTFSYNLNGSPQTPLVSTGATATITVPTTATGTFVYTITSIKNTGSTLCTQNITGQQVTINVNANHAIALTTGPASQAVCINTLITPVTYTFSGGATGVTVTGLPAGINYTVTGSTVTLSGAPNTTVGSPFNYTITTTGNSCTPATATGTITVNPDHTITLNTGNNTQTVCINKPITSITYTLGGGATGVTITGLPAGVVYSVSGTLLTISGAPNTTAGSPYNYTITTTGNACVTASATGTITVNPDHVITLTAGNPVQTVCVNTPITAITYLVPVTSGATGATVTGLPAGVNAVTSTSAAGVVVTISGTPSTTVGSPFVYNIVTTGNGCQVATATGTITVNPDHTLTLTTGNNTQTVCINKPINLISYTLGGGATGVTISGLPAGVTYSVTGTTLNITGSPTTTAGSPFNYTVTTTGNACVKATATGTITVNPDHVITLTSGNPVQTVCVNTAITAITYLVPATSGATGATVTGLPAGVNAVMSTNAAGVTINISGTPLTVVGSPFTYTITTTGNGCQVATATGTITVNPDHTIALNTGNNTQTVCINTAINLISYTLGGGATGATITGLPAGVTYSVTGTTLNITGSPSTTIGSPFNYTITTTGNACVKATATGTITVNPVHTITLTTANNTQTVCINTGIAPISYTLGGGATGATVTGLPPGVNYAVTGTTLTISGTPNSTTASPYNYSITTTGNSCLVATASGTITVTPDAAITLNSAAATTAQELCNNTAITQIAYTVSGSVTGVTVTGLPTGVTFTYTAATGTVTIDGTPNAAANTYNYTVNVTGACTPAIATGSIKVNALPTPLFTVSAPDCESKTITFTDASTPNTGTITTWAWDFGDPASGAANTSALQNPTHTYATASGTPYIVSLTVTTDKGCTTTAPYTKQVTVSLNPKAGFMVPQVCLNDPAAVFTDTSKIASGTIVGWQWNYGDPASGAANTSTGQTGSHHYTVAGSYTVTLTVFSNTGCSDVTTNTIFVNGLATSAFNITNTGTQCSNDSVSIVNKSIATPGSIIKLEIYWDDPSAAPADYTVDNSPAFDKEYKHKYPSFQSPASKTFTIKVVAYSGTTCSNTSTKTITVYASPKAVLQPFPDTCFLAAPFALTQGSSLGGLPLGSGVYTGPGITGTNIFNPALAGIGTHSILYTYTATGSGCIDTARGNITVLDTASAKFSFIAPLCENSNGTFTDLSTAPAGVVLASTIWNFGDGSPVENHAPGSTFTHVFPSGAATYTVRMYNRSVYGCTSTITQQQVTVSPLPKPVFTVDKTFYCLPNAAVIFDPSLSVIADGTENAFTYLWDFGDPSSGVNNTSVAKTPTHVYTTDGPFSVTLTITSGVGCTKSTVQPVNTIHKQPKADFTTNKPSVCIQDDVVFTDATNPIDGTTVAWNWDFGDGTTATTRSFDKLFISADTFTVKLYITNSIGCNSDTVEKPFAVYNFPEVNAGEDRYVLEGGSIKLDPTVTGQNLQFLWSPSKYLNNPTLERPTASMITEDITYRLTATGIGGCPRFDDVFIKVLKFPTIPNTFTPNNDGINDKWRIKYLESYPNCHIQVFTRTGQAVYEIQGYSDAKAWDGTLKGKPLPLDTYYYIIEPGNGRDPITGYVTILK